MIKTTKRHEHRRDRADRQRAFHAWAGLRRGVWGFACFLLLAVGQPEAEAVTLRPGDLLVSDPGANAIFLVDPDSGSQTVVASGGLLSLPRKLALGPQGHIFVADGQAFGSGGVIKVDPTTGAQVEVSSGGSFEGPLGIAVAGNGDIFVADGAANNMVKVDPITGTQEVIYDGGMVTAGQPSGTTLHNGKVLFVDEAAFTTTDADGAVLRLDPVTQAIEVVTKRDKLEEPRGIAVASDGTILVADANTSLPEATTGDGAILAVDPIDGTQTVVSAGGLLDQAAGIDVGLNGEIFVADRNAQGGNGAIFRVDRATGDQTVISSYGGFVNPTGVVVVPEPASLACFAVSALAVLSRRR